MFQGSIKEFHYYGPLQSNMMEDTELLDAVKPQQYSKLIMIMFVQPCVVCVVLVGK